jgi:hypothetical protein
MRVEPRLLILEPRHDQEQVKLRLRRAVEEAKKLDSLVNELSVKGPEERLAQWLDAVILQLGRDEEESTKLMEELRAHRDSLARIEQEVQGAVRFKVVGDEGWRLTADLDGLLHDLTGSAALLQRRADEAKGLRREFQESLSVLTQLYEGAKREGILNVDEAGSLRHGQSHWRLLQALFRPAQACLARLGRAQDDLKRYAVTRETALLLGSLPGLEPRLAEVVRRAEALLDASKPKDPPKAAPPESRGD